MPLTIKGRKILRQMEKEYGAEKTNHCSTWHTTMTASPAWMCRARRLRGTLWSAVPGRQVTWPEAKNHNQLIHVMVRPVVRA